MTLLDRDNSASASALAAKRRSAGDLLFNPKSLSREQLDRVRSCGSIGGGGKIDDDHELKSKIWEQRNNQDAGHRRSSVPDAICESDNSSEEEDGNQFPTRSTLPRSLQGTTSASTNSLPRMSTSTATTPMQKSLSVYQFLPNSVKSARYRPSGLGSAGTAAGRSSSVPKKSSSTPGLQQLFHNKRDVARRLNYFNAGEFFSFLFLFIIIFTVLSCTTIFFHFHFSLVFQRES